MNTYVTNNLPAGVATENHDIKHGGSAFQQRHGQLAAPQRHHLLGQPGRQPADAGQRRPDEQPHLRRGLPLQRPDHRRRRHPDRRPGRDRNGSGFDVNLGATIVDNGAAVVNLVRRANVGAMNLFLSGVNTYTGKTFSATRAASPPRCAS